MAKNLSVSWCPWKRYRHKSRVSRCSVIPCFFVLTGKINAVLSLSEPDGEGWLKCFYKRIITPAHRKSM